VPIGMELPRRKTAPSGDGHSILRGAAVYDGALERVGGRRIEATSAVRGRDLYVALYEAPPYDLYVAPIGVPRLTINLGNTPVVGRIASDRRGRYGGRRYALFFTPAESDAHWATSQYSRYLNIYFRDGLLDELADEPKAMLRRGHPLLDAHVGRIKPWVDALVLSIGQDGLVAADASLGLAHLIVAELARTPIRRTSTLKATALTRVQEYVAAKLSETIHVSDLAALTGLSVRRFALCFHVSLGCAPHRYILRQRIEAATRLLQSGRMPIAEVAIECGFSSQQHMTTVMRRFAGVTPFNVRCHASGIAGVKMLPASRTALQAVPAGE
jgi:AraC family transcriptional regulator